MHFGSVIGSRCDAAERARSANCSAQSARGSMTLSDVAIVSRKARIPGKAAGCRSRVSSSRTSEVPSMAAEGQVAAADISRSTVLAGRDRCTWRAISRSQGL